MQVLPHGLLPHFSQLAATHAFHPVVSVSRTQIRLNGRIQFRAMAPHMDSVFFPHNTDQTRRSFSAKCLRAYWALGVEARI